MKQFALKIKNGATKSNIKNLTNGGIHLMHRGSKLLSVKFN